MTSAATISAGSLASDSWNACAVPAKLGRTPGGRPISASTWWMASTAAPSDSPGVRLKEMVVAGNCPWWLIESGVVPGSKWAKALSGTESPLCALR